MRMQSVWQAAAAATRYPPLDRDISVDVAIVGGGITGLLCADRLLAQGATVAVIEAFSVGTGSTGNSTGNLYALVGERHGRLDDAHAPAVLQARSAGVALIEQLTHDYGIECGFVRCPWTVYGESAGDGDAIARASALARLGGLTPQRSTPSLPLPVHEAVTVDGQAQFNPLLFTQGLARHVSEAGGLVFETTRMQALDAQRRVVTTPSAAIHASCVVLATHTPKGRLRLHAEMGVFREYGVAAAVDRPALPAGIFWNAGTPNRSIRAYRFDGRDHVVVVGENHRTGDREDTAACVAELEVFLRRHFGVRSVDYRWSAQNYRPADGLPLIGPSALGDNILVATGYAADGLTYGAVAAVMIADRLGGRAHPLADALDPRRLPLGSDLLDEVANTIKQFARDIPGVGTEDVAQIAPCGGAIVDQGGEKIAVHRDADGVLHAVSAVCTHMQCIVRWNGAERSWDCPCHGSRFAADGRVIEGPALDDLPERPAPAE